MVEHGRPGPATREALVCRLTLTRRFRGPGLSSVVVMRSFLSLIGVAALVAAVLAGHVVLVAVAGVLLVLLALVSAIALLDQVSDFLDGM